MEKNTLAVFDTDEGYVTKLMDYLCEAGRLPLDVQAFTKKESLKEFMKKNPVDILLLPEDQVDDELESAGAGEMMVLTEGTNYGTSIGKGKKSVYRYQSSENILREVMCYYAESPVSIKSLKNDTDTSLIGVYSPLHSCLKTSFAITLGQLLSRLGKERVLYVNMESYAGFNMLLGQSFMMDLSDLLFYVGQKKKNFPCKLASMVIKSGELDLIPPAVSPSDLRSVSPDMWIQFFNEIMNCEYSKVIIDFGEAADGIYEVLKGCYRIYMPIKEDLVSKAKLEQYEACLRIMECAEIMDKTEKILFPKIFKGMDARISELEKSELAQYIVSSGILRQWEN
ncbi:MAG: hypothetical protein J6P05_01470 [Lachnospiraceae bacterium]|nr:hypothetical protein [Lachnospiraceae bacterium]